MTFPASIGSIANSGSSDDITIANMSYDNVDLGTIIDHSPNSFYIDDAGDDCYIGLIDLASPFAPQIQYHNVSTPYDLSSADAGATYQPTNYLFSITVADSGTRMYCGGTGSEIDQYDLQAAYTPTSLSYVRTLDLTTIATGAGNANGTAITPDGTRLFFTDNSNQLIWQTDLSTAWDISTASTATSFTPNQSMTQVNGLEFVNDGQTMIVVGEGSTLQRIDQYQLSTAYDISTAVFDLSDTPSAASIPTDVYIVRVSLTSIKMYICDQDTERVYQYSL